MELRSQAPELLSSQSNQLPEFKRQNALALLRRVKGSQDTSDWNDLVQRMEVLGRRHPEALADIEMRQAAWEVIEQLLKAGPEESEERMKERARIITFLETNFQRIPMLPKKKVLGYKPSEPSSLGM